MLGRLERKESWRRLKRLRKLEWVRDCSGCIGIDGNEGKLRKRVFAGLCWVDKKKEKLARKCGLLGCVWG